MDRIKMEFHREGTLLVIITTLLLMASGAPTLSFDTNPNKDSTTKTLNCTDANYSAGDEYIWQKNKTTLFTNIGEFKTTGKYNGSVDGTTLKLTINNISVNDEGNYSCNIKFSKSNSLYLKVESPTPASTLGTATKSGIDACTLKTIVVCVVVPLVIGIIAGMLLEKKNPKWDGMGTYIRIVSCFALLFGIGLFLCYIIKSNCLDKKAYTERRRPPNSTIHTIPDSTITERVPAAGRQQNERTKSDLKLSKSVNKDSKDYQCASSGKENNTSTVKVNPGKISSCSTKFIVGIAIGIIVLVLVIIAGLFVAEKVCPETNKKSNTPEDQEDNVSALPRHAGDTVTLSCLLSGTFPEWRGPTSLTLYTFLNDTSGTINPAVPAGSRLQYASNNRDLLLSNAHTYDSGRYQCSVKDQGTYTIILTIMPVPNQGVDVFTMQFKSQKTCFQENSNIALVVEYTGAGTPDILQWKFSEMTDPTKTLDIITAFCQAVVVADQAIPDQAFPVSRMSYTCDDTNKIYTTTIANFTEATDAGTWEVEVSVSGVLKQFNSVTVEKCAAPDPAGETDVLSRQEIVGIVIAAVVVFVIIIIVVILAIMGKLSCKSNQADTSSNSPEKVKRKLINNKEKQSSATGTAYRVNKGYEVSDTQLDHNDKSQKVHPENDEKPFRPQPQPPPGANLNLSLNHDKQGTVHVSAGSGLLAGKGADKSPSLTKKSDPLPPIAGTPRPDKTN